MKRVGPLIPRGEALRKAVRYISEQGVYDLKTIEAASIRYNLSPRDEEFLIRHFVRKPSDAQ